MPGALPHLKGASAIARPGAIAPMRFIFIHKGNGLFPSFLELPSFTNEQKQMEKKKEAFTVDLDEHTLPEWMGPLEEHKENLTLLQGLSGKMCTVGHHSWCSSLGVFKANERLSSIKWATVDFELAKLFPSPLEHIELACFPTGGGNPRGGLDMIAKGFSARGAQQPNYAFGSPKLAVDEVFKSVATEKSDQVRYQLERKLLEFVGGNEAELAKHLDGIEQRKVANYANSIENIRERNCKVDEMADVVRKHAPKLENRFLADEMSTFDRQAGHTEVLLSSLISGLTNVAAFTIDELGHDYTGITGIEGERVNMHDVGHNKSFGGVGAEDIRLLCGQYHMTLVNHMVKRLKSVPENGGTMFDNTLICYFPDGGETHHAKGTEFPFIVLAGDNAELNIGRRYIRLPYHGKEGHKTLGNFYTTLLNTYGNPIAHYGDIDTSLHGEQRGPIAEFMA